jgi:hypothetical protein
MPDADAEQLEDASAEARAQAVLLAVAKALGVDEAALAQRTEAAATAEAARRDMPVTRPQSTVTRK